MLIHRNKFPNQFLKILSVSLSQEIFGQAVIKEFIQKLAHKLIFHCLIMKPFIDLILLFSRQKLLISDFHLFGAPIRRQRTWFAQIVVKVKVFDFDQKVLNHSYEVCSYLGSNSVEALVLGIKFDSKNVFEYLVSFLKVSLPLLIFHQIVLLKETVLSVQLRAVKDPCSWDLIIPVTFGCVILVRILLVSDVVLITFWLFSLKLFLLLWFVVFEIRENVDPGNLD